MSHHHEPFVSTPFLLQFSPADHELLDGKVELIIKGQGTFVFQNPLRDDFSVSFPSKENGLLFNLSKNGAELSEIKHKIKTLIKSYPNIKIDEESKANYWVSLDSLTRSFKFGKGEVRNDLHLIDEVITNTVWPNEIQHLYYSPHLKAVELYRDPVTIDPALKIQSTDLITIDDIAKNNYIVSANLPLAGQQLYANISGANFNLNTSDFPDFIAAIEENICNPKGWCYKKLQEKAGEFGEKDIDETYLRITLGVNYGQSPGIPFVIEIWPAGHYSPIHNHAGANAIIRVLHGEIKVKLFPMLSPLHQQPFKETMIRKDDITWISARYNQTHQLHNIHKSGPSCITIQCYLYDDQNTEHYKYFDYLDKKGETKQFTPNSDSDYISFKEIIKKEWEIFKTEKKAGLKSNLK